MVEAPVGFQCPECVRAGAASIRRIQGPYGGRPSANPALTSYVLLGINAAVWVLVMVTGGGAGRLVERLALQAEGVCRLGERQYLPNVSQAECVGDFRGTEVYWSGGVSADWWQPVTSMFTHVEPWHLAGNLLVLFFLGPRLEMLIGRARFLAVYLLSGLAGSAAVLWLSDPEASSLGASGAGFGLMGAVALLTLHRRESNPGLWQLLLINGLISFTLSGISWQAHLGGFLGGFALAAILAFAPRSNRSLIQWGGFGLVFVVVLAAIVVRALQFA